MQALQAAVALIVLPKRQPMKMEARHRMPWAWIRPQATARAEASEAQLQLLPPIRHSRRPREQMSPARRPRPERARAAEPFQKKIGR